VRRDRLSASLGHSCFGLASGFVHRDSGFPAAHAGGERPGVGDPLFDGEAAIQVPMGPDALAEVPARRGVFLLVGPDAAAVLLATAANIRARLRGRLTDPAGAGRRADLREVARAVRWKLTDSRFETDWRYLELARRLYPDRYPEMVSFRPPWFVHVDPDAAAPCLTRSREPLAEAGRYYGPFPDGPSAGRFIDTLRDVFDLCRHDRVLRQAPNGRPCAYAEMGRCRSPCDGSMPMAEYRALIGRVCRCVEGDRRATADALAAEMRRLADRQQYERAAVCKGRLAALAALDGERYRYVAPAETFQFVLVQRGARRGRAKTFLVDRGHVRQGVTLTYPLQPRQLNAVLGRLRTLAGDARPVGRPQRDVIGLVSRTLFSGDAMKGLIARCGPALTAGGLAERIEPLAEALRLRRSSRPAPEAGESA